ncbi:hypothetical protein [Brevibacterium oceani]|uniref:hypothetical protein n=1 Tax=Brevibacterium oceani TaxID=358099 RepID=UPI0015E67AF0|nr:hypothetical protein [Brevibacterium oceani]
MKLASIKRLLATVAVSAIFLTGCQANQRPTADSSPAPTDADIDVPTQTEQPPSSPATPTYTDPSQADTYCDAINGLVKLSDEASKDDEETTVNQMGTRLDLLVTGTSRIGELAPDTKTAKEWKRVSNGYNEATDLFKSSGGQVSNTDFLLLLSEATQTANETYRSQSDAVDEECGVDITKLIAEEKK